MVVGNALPTPVGCVKIRLKAPKCSPRRATQALFINAVSTVGTTGFGTMQLPSHLQRDWFVTNAFAFPVRTRVFARMIPRRDGRNGSVKDLLFRIQTRHLSHVSHSGTNPIESGRNAHA